MAEFGNASCGGFGLSLMARLFLQPQEWTGSWGQHGAAPASAAPAGRAQDCLPLESPTASCFSSTVSGGVDQWTSL